MAANEIKVGINVSDNGTTNKAIKSAKDLKAAYDAAAKSASSMGGTAGSRMASQKATENYRISGGVTGRSGASARDFANEAQGLGGLVRLYATYAANVFAVGAAFRALREAAGTEMITRGLEQMGIAGGKSLTGLSRQIVELTGGAISLREAMGSVAKASASGLSTKQIQDLTTVAAKASNALGINMEDALSRVTRGVTKLEPELLDELGLFTKIGSATEAYALSIGKSASALSDFERRQAFANAVVTEGLTKFKDIDQLANPYDKLGASISNLANKGLELVNSVLSPIVRLLSESPGALVGIFAVIGTSLVKSALPAIGQLRLGLKYAAEDSLKTAESFKNSFGDKFQTLLEKRFNLEGLRQKSKVLLQGTSESIKRLSEGDMSMETTVNKMLADRTQKLAEADAGLIKLTRSQRAKINQDIEQINFAKQLGDAEKAAQAIADKSLGKWDPERLAAEKYYSLRLKGTKDSIVATAAEDAQVIGVRGSMVLLHQEIEKNGLKGWDKWSTVARGATSAIFSRLGQIVGSLGYVGQAVGLAIGAFELLNAVFSTNERQQQAYNTTLENTTNTIEQAQKSLELYSKKASTAFSLDATTAYANSIDGITTSLESQVEAFKKLEKSSSIWDKLFLSRGSVNKAVSEGITTVVELINAGMVGGTQKANLASLLKIPEKDLDNIDKVKESVKNLSSSDLDRLNVGLKQVSKEVSNANNLVISFKESLKEIDKSFNQLVNSTAFTDLQGKLGVDLVNAAGKLAASIDNPAKAVQALAEAANDVSFNSVTDNKIAKLALEAKELRDNLGSTKAELKSLTDQLDYSRTQTPYLTNIMGDTGDFTKQIFDQTQSLELVVDRVNAKVLEASKKVTDIVPKLAKVITDITSEGMKRIELALKFAQQAAGIKVAQYQTGLAKSAGIDTSRREYELTQQSLSIQRQIVEASYNAAKAQLDNTRAVEELTAQQKLERADRVLKAEKGTYTQSEVDQAGYDKKAAEDTLRIMNALRGKGGMLAEPDLVARFNAERSREKILEKQKAAASADINAQSRISLQTKEQQHLEYILELRKAEMVLDNSRLALQKESIGIASGLSDVATEELLDKEKQLALEQNLLDYRSKVADISDKINAIERNKKGYSESEYKQKLDQLYAELGLTTQAKLQRDYAVDINNILQQQQINQKKLEQSIQIQAALRSLSFTREEESLKNRSLELDQITSLGILSSEYVATQKANLDIETQKLSAKQAEAAQEDIINKKIKERQDAQSLVNKLEQDLAAGNKGVTKEALDQAKEKLNTTTQALQLAGVEATLVQVRNEEETKRLEKAKELSIYQARWNDTLKESGDLANNLAEAFGKVGEAIGGSISAIIQMEKAQQDFNKIKESGASPEELAKAEKNLQNTQLGGLTKIVSANKKMFDEKSKGYQLMTALEKGLTAVQAINNAIRLKDTIASAYAAVTAMAPAIIAQFLKWLGPWGFAAGAAAIAMLGGRASSTPTFSMSSQQLQETQGTGSTYVDNGDGTGRLVATGGGVFGDIKAKSQSIDKTLSRMEENQVDGLDQDSRLYRAFKDLDKSIIEVAKTLPSFQTSPFGTSEGTTSSSFLFGLSSSTSTQEIISSGIKLQGTFFDLMNATNDLVKIAEKVKTTTTDTFLWIFDSIDVSIEENFKDLSPRQLKAISNSFTAGAEALSSVAEVVGVDQTSVLNKLKNLPVKELVDLKGKTGQEFVDEFNAVIGGYLDEAATSLFTSFEAFRALGEGMLETVTRVIDTNAKIAQGLKNIGSATRDLTGDYKVTEAIAGLAGGIDKAVSQYNFFTENFLTDTEKLAINQSSVDKVFTKLGVTSIKTKSQFASLVKGLDLTTERGRLTYQALQDIAPQFLEVANSVESGLSKTVDSFKNFAQNIKDFKNSLLIGGLSPLTPGQKYLEAKRIAEETYVAALGGDTMAQGKLSQVASDFLEASRGYYASSEQYTIDFNYVVEALDAAEKIARDTMTDAEKQLKETETQTEVLKDILSAINTPTAADLTSTVTDTTLVEQGIQTVDALAKELKNAGAITDEQYQSTSSGLRDAAAGSNLSNEQWAAIIALRNEQGLFKNEFDSNSLKGLAGIIAGGLVSGPVATIVGEVVKAATGTESIAGFTTTYGYFVKAMDAVNRKVVETYSEEARSASESIQDYYEGWDPNDIAMEIGTAAGQALSDGINSGAIAIPINLDNNITYTDNLLDGSNAFATGGYANGLSIVGELGPELVDFKTPGRVYTAEQTFGMFNGNSSSNGELIQEIRELRKEVATLRQQQHEETMVLVEATYDSQDQNANKLASTITNSNWNAKLQQSVKLR